MRNLLALAVTFATLAPLPSQAAAVDWGMPYELITEVDIDLSFGPVVYAQNAGDNIGNEAFIPVEKLAALPDPRPVTLGATTIGFEGVNAVYGEEASFGVLGTPFETFGDAVDHVHGQSFNVTFNVRNGRSVDTPQVVFDPTLATLFDPTEEDDYSVTTGNAGLDFLLDSTVFMDSRASLGAGVAMESAGALEIYLNNLSVGTTYQVQVIGGADDRRFASDPLIIDPNYASTSTGNGVSPIGTLSDGLGNTVANVGAFLDLDSDGLGHVTTVLGTFTADSATQQIDFLLQRGRNAGISAVILTEQTTELVGDYNGDGSVNAADYTVWRDGMTVGSVSVGFERWAGNYWATQSMATSVPEPTALLIVLLGFIAMLWRGRLA
jgi:hypothetical protein